MSRRSIEYDNTSIQTANIVTEEIEHESVDHKTLDLQRLGARDGGKFLASTFEPKVIRLRGRLTYSTIALLEDGIDSFKELLNKTNKHLDIEYGSGTSKQSRRRFTVEMSRLTMVRRHFNLTFADWEAEFMLSTSSPFGTELDTSTAEFLTIESVSTYVASFLAGGTYRPNPRIVITFTEVAGTNDVRVRNITTGDSITVTKSGGFVNNDVIEIDTDNYTVTVNDVASAYTGFFPQFVAAGNDLRISVGGDGLFHYKMTVKVIYYPLYV